MKREFCIEDIYENGGLDDKSKVYVKDMYNCFLEKYNYTLSDFNELCEMEQFGRKDVVMAIVLCDWAVESFDKVINSIRKEYRKTFPLSDDYKAAKEYVKTIWSFVLAHPFNTERHEKYDMDKKNAIVAVDIRVGISGIDIAFQANRRKRCLSLKGIEVKDKDDKYDIKITSYKKGNYKTSYNTFLSFNDMRQAMQIVFDEFKALDKHMSVTIAE